MGEGADAFGCADGLEWLFSPRRDKYCHNGGMTSAASLRTDATRRQLRGSVIRTHGPLRHPQKLPICRRLFCGERDRRVWVRR